MDDAIRKNSVSMAGENVGEACSSSCARGVCCCSAAMRARAAWRSASDGASISRVLLGDVFVYGEEKRRTWERLVESSDRHGEEFWRFDKMQCLKGAANEIWNEMSGKFLAS